MGSYTSESDKDRSTKPVLRIREEAWNKIWALTLSTTIEVSSLGLMSEDFTTLEDIFVPKQVNSPGGTDMQAESINELILALTQRGIDPVRLSVWQHSHANMGVFWSDTDINTVNKFKNDVVLWSIVTNRNRKILARADIWKPFRATYDHCGVVVLRNSSVDPAWLASAKNNCSTMAARPVPTYGGRGGIQSGYDDIGGNPSGVASSSSRSGGTCTTAHKAEPGKIVSLPLLREAYGRGVLSVGDAIKLDMQFEQGKITYPEVVAAIMERLDDVGVIDLADVDPEATSGKLAEADAKKDIADDDSTKP